MIGTCCGEGGGAWHNPKDIWPARKTFPIQLPTQWMIAKTMKTSRKSYSIIENRHRWVRGGGGYFTKPKTRDQQDVYAFPAQLPRHSEWFVQVGGSFRKPESTHYVRPGTAVAPVVYIVREMSIDRRPPENNNAGDEGVIWLATTTLSAASRRRRRRVWSECTPCLSLLDLNISSQADGVFYLNKIDAFANPSRDFDGESTGYVACRNAFPFD